MPLGLAQHGDELMFAEDRARRREVLAVLARGVAVLAHQPGGVDFAARHWCTRHVLCERRLVHRLTVREVA